MSSKPNRPTQADWRTSKSDGQYTPYTNGVLERVHKWMGDAISQEPRDIADFDDLVRVWESDLGKDIFESLANNIQWWYPRMADTRETGAPCVTVGPTESGNLVTHLQFFRATENDGDDLGEPYSTFTESRWWSAEKLEAFNNDVRKEYPYGYSDDAACIYISPPLDEFYNKLFNAVTTLGVAARPVEPYRITNRASLPAFHRDIGDELPNFVGDAPPQPDQPFLPGIEPMGTIDACPSWLLWLYDQSGGESMVRGQGAPFDMHLFVSSFLKLPIRERHGNYVHLRFPHMAAHEGDPMFAEGTDSLERWLFPHGWTNKRRDRTKIIEALHRMHSNLGYVPTKIGNVLMVVPSVIPKTPDDPLVQFTIMCPKDAAHGARIDWPTLCELRQDSAPLYRGYLAVSAWLDRTAKHGHPITRVLPAKVQSKSGQPIFRNGKPLRDSTRTEPNPAARYVATLTDADIARMFGWAGDDKRRRLDARKALEQLADRGICEVVREGRNGLRIFGPAKITA